MRHLRLTGNPQIDFFRDPEFSGFRASLDEMKLKVRKQQILRVNENQNTDEYTIQMII